MVKIIETTISLSIHISVQTVEGNELELHGLTRSDMGAYLCIAANGIPSPVSKRIMVHVHCKYSLCLPNFYDEGPDSQIKYIFYEANHS